MHKCKYPVDLMERFEFHSYGHALEILTESFPLHWYEICQSLNGFGVTTNELLEAGGNETAIPGKFDAILYPLGWREMKITGDLLIKMYPRKVNQRGRFSDKPFDEKTIEGWIDGHNIDFIKDKVAFDLEWNSKDQTFDRDLLAMRTYFDCGIIDVGVIVTRSEELNEVFRALKDAKGSSLIKKYGASTTWMGKLLPRLNSRRNGGCPILAVGIRKPCVIDWKEAK